MTSKQCREPNRSRPSCGSTDVVPEEGRHLRSVPYAPFDNWFDERVDSMFSSFYLTVTGIIQGVAMAFVFYAAYEAIKGGHSLKLLLYAGVSFLSIVVVTFEYTTVATVYSWSHRIWDVLIPFTLGIAEMLPSAFLTSPKCWWYFSMAFFALVGLFAYFNTILHTKRSCFPPGDEGEIAYRATTCDLRVRLVVVIAGIGYASLVGVLLLACPVFEDSLLECYYLAGVVVCLVYCAWAEQTWFGRLHRAFGSQREGEQALRKKEDMEMLTATEAELLPNDGPQQRQSRSLCANSGEESDHVPKDRQSA